jgi:hypothetical protein
MERTLLPNKARTLFFIRISSLLFFALLVFVAIKGELKTVGWPLFCMATAIVIYALKIYPGVTYLKLTKKGLEYRNYLRAFALEWKDVDHFPIHRDRGYYLCTGWVYSEHSPDSNRLSSTLTRKWQGVDNYIWENFDHKPDELVRLLEDWRRNNSH